ncbi:unnamed protein product [Ceutorhynchus assimilis]|uniref:DUF4806 domain-containing protein n=1 Tax=Ceutorhynchus assimilis TaxID=467358 RepID=A0A9N9MKY4_9CUCU|nr:unnamed protein product [Ceutorhynchus assimilis]
MRSKINVQLNKSTLIRRTLSTTEVTAETIITNSVTPSVVDNENERASQNGKCNNCCGGHNIEESKILKSILSNVIAVKKMLEYQEKENQRTLNNKHNETVVTNFDLVLGKAFSKFRKLQKFDEKLRTDENARCQNEAALFLLGGATPKELIRRGLKNIFSDKLAMKCSWTGRKNNFVLSQLKILDILKVAVRRKFGAFTDSEFQSELGLWFRQAKLRFDRSRQKERQDENINEDLQ